MATEKEFLKNYDLSKYPAKGLTADLAIFTIREEELCVLLIKRRDFPAKGQWALPGGFVNNDETVDAAAARELGEETGLQVESAYLEQLKTYAGPTRDPRGYIASVAYVALVPHMDEPQAGDDAAEAEFKPVAEALASGSLAFDHELIIKDGLERVRAKLEYAPLAPRFLAHETFTISELRRVYEIVWGHALTPSNFRRKVQSVPNFLEAVGEKRTATHEGGRAGELYRAGNATLLFPPLRRWDTEL